MSLWLTFVGLLVTASQHYMNSSMNVNITMLSNWLAGCMWVLYKTCTGLYGLILKGNVASHCTSNYTEFRELQWPLATLIPQHLRQSYNCLKELKELDKCNWIIVISFYQIVYECCNIMVWTYFTNPAKVESVIQYLISVTWRKLPDTLYPIGTMEDGDITGSVVDSLC